MDSSTRTTAHYAVFSVFQPLSAVSCAPLSGKRFRRAPEALFGWVRGGRWPPRRGGRRKPVKAAGKH
eukprot:15477226-Alexandrium_andersonii.AAC.1